MQKKLVPIVGKGYTEDFFDVNISDEDLVYRPHLEIDGSHFATLAFQLNDEGLTEWNFDIGDFLLFSNSSDSVRDKIILVRSEGLVIIRQARHITPDISVLSTPGDFFPPLSLPSENIRIIGIMSGFIKSYDDLRIINPAELIVR